MRKAAVVIAVIVICVIVALLVIPQFVDVNRYRGRIEAELEQRLNRPVSLGPMHLRLLPPSFRVDNAIVGEDPRFGPGPFAAVQQLDVRAKLWPLLHGTVEITSLKLRRPHIELIRNAQGVWNFSSLGQNAPAEEQAPSAQSQQPQAQGQPQPRPQAQQERPFALDQLKVSDGEIALTDYEKHQSRAVYDHIDLTLDHFAPGKPFDFSLAAHLPGKGTQSLRVDGTAGPISAANLLATPLSGTLKLNQVQLAGLQKFLNTPALANTDAILSGITDIKNADGKLTADGALKIQQARVHGVEIGYPITADFKAADDLKTGIINVAQGKITLGNMPVEITGSMDTRATPILLDAKVKAENVSIADAARLAAAFGLAFDPNMKVEGRASADVHAQGPVSGPALSGTASANNLVVSGRDLPQPVKVPAIQLALTPRDIRSSPFTAQTGGTTVNAQLALAQYTTASPTLEASVRTSEANIAELLQMARAYGISAAKDVSGSGRLSLDLHASGPMKNFAAMTFAGTGRVQNASVKPASLRQPLRIQNANLQFSSHSATVQDLVASLGETDVKGNVMVRNFAAPAVQFALSADKVNVLELQQITSAPATSAPARRATAEFWEFGLRAEAQNAPGVATPAPSILQKATGSGTLSVGTLIYDQLLLNNVRSNISLDHGVIRLAPLTAQLYNGQQQGSITIDTRTTPMNVSVTSKLNNVKANELISSVSSVKDTIYGLLAANTEANFRVGNSTDLARTLNGNLALDLTNGRIAKLDLLNQLAAIGKFAGLRKNAQAVTDVAKLTGHFNIVNGVANTNDLQAQIAGGSFAATGAVNLVTQQLDLHLTAVMSKGFTEQVGGVGGIGGLMQTALANSKGELVIPVLITGTFDDPRVAPDLQKVAQMKLQNLLPTTGNPAATSAGILGKILGRQAGTAVPGQQGGVAGSILGAMGGQQQKQGQQGQQTETPPVASPTQQQQRPDNTNPLQQAIEAIMGGKKQQKQQTK